MSKLPQPSQIFKADVETKSQGKDEIYDDIEADLNEAELMMKRCLVGFCPDDHCLFLRANRRPLQKFRVAVSRPDHLVIG